MSISNKELGNEILKQIKQRMYLNLRAGCTENITLRFTRQELRELTGAQRIEDATMTKILNDLELGGVTLVRGTGKSNSFEVVLNVLDHITNASSLENLTQRNNALKRALNPKPAPRPAKP